MPAYCCILLIQSYYVRNHEHKITRVVNAYVLTLIYSQREFALGVRRRQIKDVVGLGKLI